MLLHFWRVIFGEYAKADVLGNGRQKAKDETMAILNMNVNRRGNPQLAQIR